MEGGGHKGESVEHSGPPLLVQHPYPLSHREAAEDSLAKVAVPPGRPYNQDMSSAQLSIVPSG